MPPLTADEISAWDKPKVLKTLGEHHDEVKKIRAENGGTLVGVKGEDAERVTELMASTNLLGARRDELVAQEGADVAFDRLEEFLKTPVDKHPGHGGKGGQARKQGPRDIGGMFIESDAYKAFKNDGQKDIEAVLDLAGLMPGYRGIGELATDERLQTGATLFDTSAWPFQPDFRQTPIDVLFQPNNIGALMAQGTTSQTSIRYVVETVTATGAAETAEGATKPEAQLSFATVDEPVRKIPVLLPITDETLEDAPFLRAYINARLRLFVQMREDSQLLNGNGTAPNLKGLLNRSGINTATSYSIGGSNPDQALIDAIFHAAMRVRDAFLEPDAAVIKPSTWEIARLAKDGNRNYIVGPPTADVTPRLWGLNIVLNANMPAQVATNKVALVGAFQASAMLVRRSDIVLAISDSHSTFFAENKLMLRAEERVALCVFRPAGFAAVTSAA